MPALLKQAAVWPLLKNPFWIILSMPITTIPIFMKISVVVVIDQLQQHLDIINYLDHYLSAFIFEWENEIIPISVVEYFPLVTDVESFRSVSSEVLTCLWATAGVISWNDSFVHSYFSLWENRE